MLFKIKRRPENGFLSIMVDLFGLMGKSRFIEDKLP